MRNIPRYNFYLSFCFLITMLFMFHSCGENKRVFPPNLSQKNCERVPGGKWVQGKCRKVSAVEQNQQACEQRWFSWWFSSENKCQDLEQQAALLNSDICFASTTSGNVNTHVCVASKDWWRTQKAYIAARKWLEAKQLSPLLHVVQWQWQGNSPAEYPLQLLKKWEGSYGMNAMVSLQVAQVQMPHFCALLMNAGMYSAVLQKKIFLLRDDDHDPSAVSGACSWALSIEHNLQVLAQFFKAEGARAQQWESITEVVMVSNLHEIRLQRQGPQRQLLLPLDPITLQDLKESKLFQQ